MYIYIYINIYIYIQIYVCIYISFWVDLEGLVEVLALSLGAEQREHHLRPHCCLRQTSSLLLSSLELSDSMSLNYEPASEPLHISVK